MQPSLPGPPIHSISSHGHKTASDQPKLRNSCHACASSKLKCSQDKPTCARCAKRGITCEYMAAKRGGRKSNNRSNNGSDRGDETSLMHVDATNREMHMPWQGNWLAASSTNTHSLLSPALTQPSQKPTISGSSDMLTEFFGSVDQTLPSSGTDTDTGLEDFFASPMSFSLPDISDTINTFDPQNVFPISLNGGSSSGSRALCDNLPVTEDAFSELLAFSSPTSTPRSFASSARETHHNWQQDFRTTDSLCCCLIQALGLMKELISQPSSGCLTLASQHFDSVAPVLTIETVIAQNEATIDAVSKMLRCGCSQDRYLLAVMSLIIFKVLDWYTTAARQTNRSQELSRSCQPSQSSEQGCRSKTTVVGNYCLDGEDSARMAAQLVLSELHRVRRLVDQLSSKLKVQAARRARAGAETPESMDSDSEMTLPFSAIMYDQLDVDLRTRLRTLSGEMIDRLKRL